MSSIFAGILLDLLHIVKLIAFDGANYLFGALFAGNRAAKLVNYYGGKTVLITGASSGIGKSLAAHLFKLGANIIISSRSATSLKACADEILSHRQENVGNQIICIPLDLEKLPEISVYVDNLKSVLLENKLSSIDIVINNAGVSSRGPALDTTIETLQSIMAINFFGPVALTNALLPWLLERNKHTSIAVVSSVQGKLGIPLRTSYAASKHALQGYFDSFRAEVESQGVSVTVVSPGYVKTALSLNAVRPDGSKHGQMDETTAKGAHPDKVAEEILLAIARRDKEVILADTKTVAAIQARALFPDLLANILRLKKDK